MSREVIYLIYNEIYLEKIINLVVICRILGIVFLIFGLLTLTGSLIYCVVICRDVKHPKDVRPEDMYWTHHWQKTIGSAPPSEIHYRAEEKYPDADRYSDRYSVSKMSTKYSDRGGQRY